MPAAGDFDDVRPRRLLDWRDEDGRCVLLRPRLGSARLARWVTRFGGDPHYRIRLDEVGSLVWRGCDGKTSLTEIVGRMRERFGDRVEPADERLVRFIRQLLKGRMIALAPAENPPAPSDA